MWIEIDWELLAWQGPWAPPCLNGNALVPVTIITWYVEQVTCNRLASVSNYQCMAMHIIYMLCLVSMMPYVHESSRQEWWVWRCSSHVFTADCCIHSWQFCVWHGSHDRFAYSAFLVFKLVVCCHLLHSSLWWYLFEMLYDNVGFQNPQFWCWQQQVLRGQGFDVKLRIVLQDLWVCLAHACCSQPARHWPVLQTLSAAYFFRHDLTSDVPNW